MVRRKRNPNEKDTSPVIGHVITRELEGVTG